MAPKMTTFMCIVTLMEPFLCIFASSLQGPSRLERIQADCLQKQLKEKDTTGPGWFELPKTEMTAELKRDLQVISMRDALDSKRFFKKDKSSSKVPKYSQVGHIVEGNTEFYSARQSKKERKRTIVEEVLAEEAKNHKHKRKYNEIMAENRRNASLNRRRTKRKK